ncbi:hypothetical protein BM1_08595 [Bipolaris maydis]|nr:hypothetical protein BM1_08595 [Bipolaris maydis]
MKPPNPHNPKRNETFHPAHIPIDPNATLHPVPSRITGPLPFLNPTKAHYHLHSHPNIRFKWTSRNDRKGRHALSVSQPHTSDTTGSSSNTTTPRPTSSAHPILANMWKMATYYPIWDLSFLIAYIFTLGSILWILNAFFVFLPLVRPETGFAGFLASLAQFAGATVFWVAGFTALPGIYDRMSKPVTIVFYWTPQVVGGLGFIISGFLFMIETQPTWWKPAPRTLGWWIGALNLIGGVGFTLCPAFGYDSSSWAQYQACLSTFWGSWAFLIGSTLQWYESLEKFPVEISKAAR